MRFLILTLLCSMTVGAQQRLLDIPNDLKVGHRTIKDAFAVVTESQDKFAIFIDDNKTLNGYLYNSEVEQIAKYASEGLPNRYDQIIGQTIKGNQIHLFLKDKSNKRFGSILFDFDSGKSIETEIDFKLKKDRYLQSHSYKDQFYILTVNKSASILNLYVFDHSGKFTKKSFDFTDKPIRDHANKASKLFDLVSEAAGFSANIDVAKIDETNPNAIDVTSNNTKVYDRRDSFVLSVDEGKLFTYLFYFSVPDLSVDFKAIMKPQLTKLTEYDKNNSYLFEDKLFMIAGNASEMVFSVKDVNTKKELKMIRLEKDSDLYFKNTPIIQEGGLYSPDRVREMEKTSKFLRKIASGNVGLAVIPFEDGYQITMGGLKKIQSGGMAMPMGGFGGIPIATAGAFTVTFNPTFYAYSSYSGSKSTRIECLFDASFNDVTGNVPENPFTKIKAYAEDVHSPNAENVFKMNGAYIYGTYKDRGDIYELTKFE